MNWLTAKLEATFLLAGSFLRLFLGAFHFGRRDTFLQNQAWEILPNANSASFHVTILLFHACALLSSNGLFCLVLYVFMLVSFTQTTSNFSSKCRKNKSTGEIQLLGEMLEILQHTKDESLSYADNVYHLYCESHWHVERKKNVDSPCLERAGGTASSFPPASLLLGQGMEKLEWGTDWPKIFLPELGEAHSLLTMALCQHCTKGVEGRAVAALVALGVVSRWAVNPGCVELCRLRSAPPLEWVPWCTWLSQTQHLGWDRVPWPGLNVADNSFAHSSDQILLLHAALHHVPPLSCWLRARVWGKDLAMPCTGCAMGKKGLSRIVQK